MLIDTPPAWGSPRFLREVVSLEAKAVTEECVNRKLKRQEIKSFDFIEIPPFCHGYPFYDDHNIYYICSQYFDAVEMGISIRNADGLGFIFCISQEKVCREENVMVSKIAYLTGKKECISIICLIKDRRKG